MAVKLRLQRKGRKKAPFYHIIVADSRAPRDGRFIEKIGTYNPLTVPATIELNRDLAYDWLMKGAEPTDTVNAILRFKGVLLRKHLSGGVAKGVITQEDADAKLAAWIEEKETRIAARREATKEQKIKHTVAVDGKIKIKVKPVVEAPLAEEVAEDAVAVAAPEVAEEVAPVAEEAAAVVAEESAPVAEEAATPEAEEKSEDA